MPRPSASQVPHLDERGTVAPITRRLTVSSPPRLANAADSPSAASLSPAAPRLSPVEELALAVIERTCADLRGGGGRRDDAREDVRSGRLSFWLDVLDLGEEQRRYMLARLEGLARRWPS